MRKELEIAYSEGQGIDKVDFKGKIVLKRLSFYEKNQLEEEATDIKIMGGFPQVKISTSKMKEVGILKSVEICSLIKTTYTEDQLTKNLMPINLPYQLDITGIRNLPQSLGNQLFEEFTALNSIDEKKND